MVYITKLYIFIYILRTVLNLFLIVIHLLFCFQQIWSFFGHAVEATPHNEMKWPTRSCTRGLNIRKTQLSLLSYMSIVNVTANCINIATLTSPLHNA